MVYIVDMDGTIYKGKRPIEHAKEFIRYLRDNGRKFIMVTNCPGSTTGELILKLAQMGIDIDAQNVLTSGQITASLISGYKAAARIYLIGNRALREELEEKGAKIVKSKPDYVIVGFDRSFNYEKMKSAVRYINGGAKFIVTNSDDTIPEDDTVIPHTGAIAAGIEKATGVKPLVIGKPEKYVLDAIIQKLNCSRDECCIIGDRLDTDIAMGASLGIPAYLVMTGVTSRNMLKDSPIKPDKVFENLGELMNYDRMCYH